MVKIIPKNANQHYAKFKREKSLRENKNVWKKWNVVKLGLQKRSSKCPLGILCNLSFPGTFIDFCFMIFTKVLTKYLAFMLIHVRKLFNCRVSFKILFSMWLVILGMNLEHSCDEVTFRMLLSNKITITVTEVVLSSVLSWR